MILHLRALSAGPGLFVGLLAALLLSAAADAASPENLAPSQAFHSIDPSDLVARSDRAVGELFGAFNRRDREAFMQGFAQDPLILADGVPLISGATSLQAFIFDAPASLSYEPTTGDGGRSFATIGKWVVETSLLSFNFKMSPEGEVISDPRQCLTIWEQVPDGSLKVKLLAWNKLGAPEILHQCARPTAFEASNATQPLTQDGPFGDVVAAEKAFHAAFAAQEVEKAAEYYADGATLILPEILPLHGREAIAAHLKLPAEELKLVDVECRPVHLEGNGSHVLVVNLFHWKFAVAGTEIPLTILGKGVHLWERGEDGQWRILFDLPNVSSAG
ncbi:MAG: hypothetical protein E1N59_1889 [Puniceicoccaceae bacterium 5H]|nr:MAG: hypothetical protein E1N59_1889 [Puniceicoccaceae bacterium 5H]